MLSIIDGTQSRAADRRFRDRVHRMLKRQPP
jgi:hypothetical protein